MKLAIFNGSPRNKKSNSKILTEQFLDGYTEICNEPTVVRYLADIKEREQAIKTFLDADTCVIIFPLYTDCMPGIVKDFFEQISGFNINKLKRIGFIVQSGFPESKHSVYLERYLKKLVSRLNCEYIGTVIKGGVEGIQYMPPNMTKKLFTNFRELGKHFASTEKFSYKIMKRLAKPFKLPLILRILLVIAPSGLVNMFWNMQLKQNGAWEKRFDRPFI
jgi:NAD(P)H-dependent FMN reductase